MVDRPFQRVSDVDLVCMRSINNVLRNETVLAVLITECRRLKNGLVVFN